MAPQLIPLTQAQVSRLEHLAAYGPCTRVPIDDTLKDLGWIERYDGKRNAVWLVDGATDVLFDSAGCVRDSLKDDGLTLDDRAIIRAWGEVERMLPPTTNAGDVKAYFSFFAMGWRAKRDEKEE